jgi:DNA repair protein RadC
MEDRIILREMTIHYSARPGHLQSPVVVSRRILSGADAADALVAMLQAEVAEVFGILCLSTRCEILGWYQVSRGTLDGTLVHPREVFKAAMLANASRIILAHNHPSGDPTPSDPDRHLTRRLVCAGDMLGIPVVDHLVIGDGRWVSLRDIGWM